MYDEEFFDCIKSQIANNSGGEPSKKIERLDQRRASKARRRERREQTRDELTARYGEDIFLKLSTRAKRRKIKDELTDHERGVLAYYANQEKQKTRKARKREGHGKRLTYTTYINSRAWEKRRNLYWQSFGKRCAACDTHSYVQLHHMSYKQLGNEPDNHLIALCQAHHKQYHDENGVQRHMVRKTLAFVERERAAHLAALH